MRSWHSRPAILTLWAALGLAGFVSALYFALLFTGRVLASGDILHYFYPYRDMAAAAVRAGELPFWNPYIFLGAPFLANPQAAVLYPLHWPLSWLSVTEQINWSAALHTWLLGMGGYALMRHWRASFPAALATALVLSGSGFYGGLMGHINQMNGATWLPWLLLAVERTYRLPIDAAYRTSVWGMDWRRLAQSSAICGLITALMVLAGHTQTAYINLFGVGIWAALPLMAWLWRQLRPANRSPRHDAARDGGLRVVLAPLIAYGGGVALALLLAAAQLLPTLELSALGLRGGGLTYAEASSFSLRPLLLPWTLLPAYGVVDLAVVFGTLGYTEYVAYVGWIGLALGLYGAWHGRRQRSRAWQAGLCFAVVGLFLAAGRWNPVYYLLYQTVPGFDLFRAPARWMMLYTLGMAIWAGLGMEALCWRIRMGRLRPVRLAQGLTRPAELAMLFLLMALALDLWAASRALPHAQTTAPQAVTDLRSAPAHLLTDPARALHPAAGGRFLSMSTMTFDPGDMSDYRRIFVDSEPPQLDARAFEQLVLALKSQELLAPNLSMLWRVPAVDGFDGGVLPLDRYIRFLTLFIEPDQLVPDGRLREQVQMVPSASLLGLLNAQYLITDKVRDLWFDDVYYDRQIGARLQGRGPVEPVNPGGDPPWHSRQTNLSVDVPIPFEATHIDVIGFVDGDLGADVENRTVAVIQVLAADGKSESLALSAGAQPGAHFADGDLDSPAAVQSGAVVAYRDVDGQRQEYRARLALATPLTPETLRFQLQDDAPAVIVQAVTLYDARTGMFEALLPSDRGHYERVHSGDVKIYENHDVLPRAYVVSQWHGANDVDEALTLLRDGAVDPARQAVIEGVATQGLDAAAPGVQPAVGSAQLVAYAPARVDVQVTAQAPAMLVLTDAYYPGWRAQVDGVEAPIFAANVLSRAVPVAPGTHTVTFTYTPTHFTRGRWLSGIGLCSLGALLAAARSWRRSMARPWSA